MFNVLGVIQDGSGPTLVDTHLLSLPVLFGTWKPEFEGLNMGAIGIVTGTYNYWQNISSVSKAKRSSRLISMENLV